MEGMDAALMMKLRFLNAIVPKTLRIDQETMKRYFGVVIEGIDVLEHLTVQELIRDLLLMIKTT